MLIYDKKDNSIDIYSIQEKKDELKRFKKSVLQKHKNEQLFYSLKTNCEQTIQRFRDADDLDIRFLSYDNSTPLDVGTWSSINVMQNSYSYDTQTQKEILEKYIDGAYDDLVPTRTSEFIWQDDLDCEIHRLLKPEEARIVSQNSQGNVWEIKNMINLPRSLYLLHLLQHGKFSKLVSENITRQLNLFEIDYLRSVSLKDIEDMIKTGLVSGTVIGAIEKAETGSKILQKIKK